ncbi:hypothetical protein M378DRAFT_24205 [Amanita muscaria Koide BX008]|uniref:HNH nuclease domain-containing protein n=1 Tax=Amanita muscaria (strain Koide BX008) TaxID=946122 RepID=A0A0C2SPN0_AMAMK|nr:hypothetical protein M378DRAFT_24205 [Amanita muscaria Koide BX008]
MPSTPLPSLVPSNVQHMAGGVNAYNMLLRLEKTILADIDDSAAKKSRREEAERSLMYCRIVGHFFHHVPTDTGLSHLVREVSSTAGDKQQLLDLGKLYYNHALRVFRTAKARTPAQSSHRSRRSFGNVEDLVATKLEEASHSHQTAKIKALVRDGFKCVVSGAYDVTSALKCAELMQKVQGNLAGTVCVHIFPESTNVGVSEGSSKTVLSRFSGRENLSDELNGDRIHRLENVMTLELNIHFFFDNFDLWLEPKYPAGVENEYENAYDVKAIPILLHQYPPDVKFTTTDPINFPLPSRDYLAVHAACANVAHLSGAAEYLDSMFKDMERMLVLSEDGSSAAVLEHAIWGKLISV